MKKMKKAVVLMIALILALGVLAGCGSSAPAGYEVLVNDEDGNPVQGATIQFCSDTECVVEETDEKGIATFEKEAGKYTIHVLKVPDGFAKDDTEYAAPEEPGQVNIVLKK